MAQSRIRTLLHARLHARLRGIYSQSGFLARLIRQRNAFDPPVRRAVIDVARDVGLGDVIMATAALRELKRRNPTGRIRFYTKLPDLVQGLPYIDQVLPDRQRPQDAIYLKYLPAVPSRFHVGRLMGDKLGIKVVDTLRHVAVQQAVAVFAERAGIPDGRVHR